MSSIVTADSSSSVVGGGVSADGGGGIVSPQFRRKNLPSPWAQIVRGGDNNSNSDSVSAVLIQSPPSPPSSSASPTPEQQQQPASNSDNSNSKKAAAAAATSAQSLQVSEESSDGKNGNAARPKKPAWKKPTANGVVEAVTNPVLMGAESWPSLSAAANAKVSPKSSPPTPPVILDTNSISIADLSVPTSQGPVASHPSKKQASATGGSNATTTHTGPNHKHGGRKKYGKQYGGGGNGNNNTSSGGAPSQSGGFPHAPAQGSFPHPPPPPPPPPFPLFPVPPNGYPGFVPAVPEPPAREPHYRGNNWETRPGGGLEHRHSRRGYNGPRGDGPGGRRESRDHDRGNHSNPRDVHMQPHRGPPRGYFRPPPPNPNVFVPPQPARPFGNPIGYPELLYVPTMPMEHFRGMPFIPSPTPALIMPVPEPPLPALLVHQIEYYFSDANLVKDDYLRSNMDAQGWIPISLIAGFPRVKSLTNSISLILDSLRTSNTVEIQDDKLRRRNEWMKWVPNPALVTSESGSQSGGDSTTDAVTTSLQKVTVEEEAADQNTVTGKTSLGDVGGSHSSEFNNQSQFSGGADNDGSSSMGN